MTKIQLKKFREMLEEKREEIIKRAQQTLDQDMALDTVATLARGAGVQPSALVRFAQALGYDGFSELWFDNEDDLNAALASPEGKTLLADLPNLTNDIYPIIAVEHRKLDD